MSSTLTQYSPQLPARLVLAPTGGHNFKVWDAAFGPAIDWIAKYLPAPLVAPDNGPDQPIG
jgi:S-formylglutathione hydrolase FrmB